MLQEHFAAALMHVSACALAFAKVYAKKGIATLLWFAERVGMYIKPKLILYLLATLMGNKI